MYVCLSVRLSAGLERRHPDLSPNFVSETIIVQLSIQNRKEIKLDRPLPPSPPSLPPLPPSLPPLPPQDSTASYDFAHHDSDPTPDSATIDSDNSHGTSCAGEVGMAKGNGLCGAGVAYNSKIAGV